MLFACSYFELVCFSRIVHCTLFLIPKVPKRNLVKTDNKKYCIPIRFHNNMFDHSHSPPPLSLYIPPFPATHYPFLSENNPLLFSCCDMCMTCVYSWCILYMLSRLHIREETCDMCPSGCDLLSLLWWSPMWLCPLPSLFVCLWLIALPSAMLWCSTTSSQTEQVLAWCSWTSQAPDCKLK